MFSKACVSYSVHKGELAIFSQTPWYLDRSPKYLGKPTGIRILWDTVNKVVVRILLECILVFFYNFHTVSRNFSRESRSTRWCVDPRKNMILPKFPENLGTTSRCATESNRLVTRPLDILNRPLLIQIIVTILIVTCWILRIIKVHSSGMRTTRLFQRIP